MLPTSSGLGNYTFIIWVVSKVLVQKHWSPLSHSSPKRSAPCFLVIIVIFRQIFDIYISSRRRLRAETDTPCENNQMLRLKYRGVTSGLHYYRVQNTICAVGGFDRDAIINGCINACRVHVNHNEKQAVTSRYYTLMNNLMHDDITQDWMRIMLILWMFNVRYRMRLK